MSKIIRVDFRSARQKQIDQLKKMQTRLRWLRTFAWMVIALDVALLIGIAILFLSTV